MVLKYIKIKNKNKKKSSQNLQNSAISESINWQILNIYRDKRVSFAYFLFKILHFENIHDDIGFCQERSNETEPGGLTNNCTSFFGHFLIQDKLKELRKPHLTN